MDDIFSQIYLTILKNEWLSVEPTETLLFTMKQLEVECVLLMIYHSFLSLLNKIIIDTLKMQFNMSRVLVVKADTLCSQGKNMWLGQGHMLLKNNNEKKKKTTNLGPNISFSPLYILYFTYIILMLKLSFFFALSITFCYF